MLESSPLTAGEIMTSPIVTALADTPLRVVIRQMLTGGFSGVPVVDAEGRAIGMITEGDFLRWSEELNPKARWWLDMLADGHELAENFLREIKEHHALVGAVMAPGVVGVSAGTPIRDVAALLVERHVKRVPVLEDGKPVGMITRRDLVRAMLPSV